VSMARRLKKSSKQIILDCGSADFALKGNCAMDSLMRTENVAHSFYTRRGTHDWRYVKAHAPRHLVSVGRSLLPPE
jgi:S-formylglutathione hydrolase FrmB